MQLALAVPVPCATWYLTTILIGKFDFLFPFYTNFQDTLHFYHIFVHFRVCRQTVPKSESEESCLCAWLLPIVPHVQRQHLTATLSTTVIDLL